MQEHADCYRCGSPEHWVNSCPTLSPATSEKEHMDRIALYVDLWADGKMTLEQKRVAISLENQMWYGDQCPKHLIYAPAIRSR